MDAYLHVLCGRQRPKGREGAPAPFLRQGSNLKAWEVDIIVPPLNRALSAVAFLLHDAHFLASECTCVRFHQRLEEQTSLQCFHTPQALATDPRSMLLPPFHARVAGGKQVGPITPQSSLELKSDSVTSTVQGPPQRRKSRSPLKSPPKSPNLMKAA
jgi:hypothetical protein